MYACNSFFNQEPLDVETQNKRLMVHDCMDCRVGELNVLWCQIGQHGAKNTVSYSKNKAIKTQWLKSNLSFLGSVGCIILSVIKTCYEMLCSYSPRMMALILPRVL